jgi:hypothetical protein
MTALRYVGRSAASAALGLIVIGLGMEAYQFGSEWYRAYTSSR